jgi:hypothetical protein
MAKHERVMELLGEAKALAREYYSLTGKPLGVTGEVAEYEAARILGVELTAARQAGYDAIERVGGATKKLQKGVVYRKTVSRDSDWDRSERSTTGTQSLWCCLTTSLTQPRSTKHNGRTSKLL